MKESDEKMFQGSCTLAIGFLPMKQLQFDCCSVSNETARVWKMFCFKRNSCSVVLDLFPMKQLEFGRCSVSNETAAV
jgi:hypothetical protein